MTAAILPAFACFRCGVVETDEHADLISQGELVRCRYSVQCDLRRLRRFERTLATTQAEIAERCDKLRETAAELRVWVSNGRSGSGGIHPSHAANRIAKIADEISAAKEG